MNNEVFSIIGSFFTDIFGSGLIITAVIVFLFIILIIAMKGNMAVVLVVIIPLAVGFALNSAGTDYISFPTWTILILFMIASLIFAMFFMYLLNR